LLYLHTKVIPPRITGYDERSLATRGVFMPGFDAFFRDQDHVGNAVVRARPAAAGQANGFVDGQQQNGR
jgi:hypothetical protein